MDGKVLITWGGWDGHEPDKVADLFRELAEAEGLAVDLTDSLSCFDDAEALRHYAVIVPVWTMSSIGKEQADNAAAAVAAGTGMAGCHGGMCDAFRENVVWQFMTGAQWVAHPGNDGVEYQVRIADPDSPLVAGIGDFTVASEQYYLHVDPAVHVLADTAFPVVNGPHAPNGPVRVPVAFTKLYGAGRVYYNSLGHKRNVIDHGPAREMLRRGLVWAAGG